MEVDEPKAGSKSTSYAEQVAQNRALAASGSLDGALQNLMALEKTARLVRAPPPLPPAPPAHGATAASVHAGGGRGWDDRARHCDGRVLLGG